MSSSSLATPDKKQSAAQLSPPEDPISPPPDRDDEAAGGAKEEGTKVVPSPSMATPPGAGAGAGAGGAALSPLSTHTGETPARGYTGSPYIVTSPTQSAVYYHQGHPMHLSPGRVVMSPTGAIMSPPLVSSPAARAAHAQRMQEDRRIRAETARACGETATWQRRVMCMQGHQTSALIMDPLVREGLSTGDEYRVAEAIRAAAAPPGVAPPNGETQWRLCPEEQARVDYEGEASAGMPPGVARRYGHPVRHPYRSP